MAHDPALTRLSTQASEPPSWARVLFASLAQLKGQLRIQQGPWQQLFGQPKQGLYAELQVHDVSFYRQVIKGGSIGAAEAYIDGAWDSPDLTQLVILLAANSDYLDRLELRVGWFSRLGLAFLHRRNRNSQAGSKRNIYAHYDLSNAFYQQFLDARMMYSSGVYPHSEASLQQASDYKLKRLCDGLQLCASDHLLEIGTGWGGLACYAAQHYGCRVTTTTISEAQYEYAQAHVQALGLSEQITLLKQDYRQLSGSYDKLIAIEMIEAVGFEHLPNFFKQCQRLVKPNGKIALQVITIACQREAIYRSRVDFIQRYIFPGGYLPSVTVLTQHLANYTQLAIRSLDDIGQDYAQTLLAWRTNFESRLEQIKALGFDEQFIRMWRYYFCYCEGGFRQKSISTVQLILEKGDG